MRNYLRIDYRSLVELLRNKSILGSYESTQVFTKNRTIIVADTVG